MDGISLETYLSMTKSERYFLNKALSDMIERTDDEGGEPTRPKDWR